MIIKKHIITGATALYLLGYISFNPPYTSVEVEKGTKTSYYSKKYQVFVQSKDTIDIGTFELDGNKIYRPERLYIELNKFPLENTIKSQALKALEAKINPELVKKYYDQLKKKRRNLDKHTIEKFIEKNLMNVKEVFATKKFNPDQILREYIVGLLARKNIPLTLIKGGAAVELLIKNKRATQDIDMHSDKDSILDIIEYLQDQTKIIHFKFPEIEQLRQSLKSDTKRIFSITAYPQTKSRLVGFEQLKGIDLTFNTNYDHQQLNQFIKDFKIVKHNLKAFPNATAMLFTKEMLIAEKYQSLISKPEQSTRTKDLIDLGNLFDEHTRLDKVYDWLQIKWTNIREPKSSAEFKDIIINNKDKELIKIKDNFEAATMMYGITITYETCMKAYTQINEYILSRLH